ncbi:MAG: hypothetical protein ACOZNI_03245 [Myxococcota bacterium]
MIPLPSQSPSLAALSSALDAASHDARVAWMRGLGKREIVALWALAEGHPVPLADLHAGEGDVVIHEGQNSLPLFNVFQKRVVRRGDVVQGYNHQFWSWFTGPGHFFVRGDGDAYFDYTSVPESAPAVFPPLAPNDGLVSQFVYGGMIDRLRKICRHGLVGMAERGGKPTGDYFLLVRPPTA